MYIYAIQPTMKYTLAILCFLFVSATAFSQDEKSTPFSIEADFYHGTILEHNPDIAHLITEHPKGVILSFNKKTYGFREAERRYGYPDWGVTFVYQDFQNPILGENYSLYGHFNWFFLKRHLVFRIGQGIGYNTNPYDPETNFLNNAFGSHLLSSTFLKANFIKENIWEGFGVHAGFSIIHYSNANFRAPNNSTNTFAFNAGVSYLFDHDNIPEYVDGENDPPSKVYAERFKLNLVYRFGWNESDVVGSGQFPFKTYSVFVDKRIGYKSTLQFGADYFDSKFLEEFIKYRAIAFPEDNLTGEEDYIRIGVFIGHDLRFHRTAFVAQLGYYVKWDFEFENRVYNRLGVKRYFWEDRIFAVITVKSHWAKAEGVEFGIGVRL